MLVLKEIYLDNAATTRVDPDVAAAALDMMTNCYGNPSSLHKKGLEAQLRLDGARQQVARALGCSTDEVIFTSGGTESNNLAILGCAQAKKRRGNTVVIMASEHSSVLEAAKHLEDQGFTVRRINPLRSGQVDVQSLVEAVDDDTILLSCMLVNSEVGTVSPIADIVKQVRRRTPQTLIHCDAVQALGKVPFSASKLGVDMLTVSAHKIHAPKGCGALYIKNGVRILPLVYGGPHEKSLRPGTESTPLCCAFGLAAGNACRDLSQNLEKVTLLREHFVKKAETMPGICMNSTPESTPYISNISVPGYRSETLLHYLAERGVFVSSGSACSKGAASHVLVSMGLPQNRVDSALRISLNAQNTAGELDFFFDTLQSAMAVLAKS